MMSLLRIARHVSPLDWMRTLVSRPVTVVTCGAPERTSRHMGALLSGWLTWRCASADGDAFSEVGAGVAAPWVCAVATADHARTNAASSLATCGRWRCIARTLLDAVVLVLRLRTLRHRALPRRLVAVIWRVLIRL